MARGPGRPDHHDAVIKQLAAAGCTRMEHVGEGAHRWYCPKTKIVILVEGHIYMRSEANEVLRQAGLPPMFP